MPLIVDRYISWEIMRPFGAGLGLLVLIFIGYSAARYLSLAAAGQLEMLTAFKLVGLNTLISLEVMLPSALFFSVLAAIGRLYRDAEMYALYGSGVSRARILESVLKFSLLIAVITGVISIQGRPWAFRTSYILEARAAANFDLKNMAAGQFVELQGSDYVFFAKGLDLREGVHKEVFLFKKHPEHRRAEILVARAALLPVLHPDEPMQAEFHDGFNYLLDGVGRQDLTLEFGQLVVRLPNVEAREEYRRKAATTLDLSMSDQPKDIAEYQWRITTPLATVLLALMAVPLSRTTPRESRFRNFAVALAVYIALFSMVSVLRTWIEQGKMGSIPGLWAAYVAEVLLLAFLVRSPRMRRR